MKFPVISTVVLCALVWGCAAVQAPQTSPRDSRSSAWPFASIAELNDRCLRVEESRLNAWLAGTPEPARPGYLGIGMRDAQDGETEGLVAEVTAVVRGMPAERAGLRPGDRIIEVDGRPAASREGLPAMAVVSRVIREAGAGSSISLRIKRGDGMLEIPALLSERPRVNVMKDSLAGGSPGSTRPNLPSILETRLASEPGAGSLYASSIRRIRDASTLPDDPFEISADYRLESVTRALRDPMSLAPVANALVENVSVTYDSPSFKPSDIVAVGLNSLEMPGIEPMTAGFGNPHPLVRLIDAMMRAQHMKDEALAGLGPDDRDILVRDARLIFADGESRLFAESDERTIPFLKAAGRVDLGRLLHAGLLIAEAVDAWAFRVMDPASLIPSPLPAGWRMFKKNDRTVLVTPAGIVVIGTPGPDRYEEPAAVIIDPGGEDRYEGHATGAGTDGGFHVIVDLGGDDAYLSSGSFGQGAGFFGAGYLFDLAGNDRYVATDVSQGSGVFGIGGLFDYEGDDRYTCRIGCQGVSAFGIGILMDGAGEDEYSGSLFSQGVGQVKGYGLLLDHGGDDTYRAGGLEPDHRDPEHAFRSFSQGFGTGNRPGEFLVGTSGGIGMLVDESGDDRYESDYFGQGAGYWFGLGILADREGSDTFRAGRYAQGAGIHMAAGILMDAGGDDEYRASFGVAQGCGHDMGVGILLDRLGEDRYQSGELAQGAGNIGGFGILLDASGGDSFRVREKGQGVVLSDDSGRMEGLGVLLDAGPGKNKFLAEHPTDGPRGIGMVLEEN